MIQIKKGVIDWAAIQVIPPREDVDTKNQIVLNAESARMGKEPISKIEPAAIAINLRASRPRKLGLTLIRQT
jgi:hypothetical protein